MKKLFILSILTLTACILAACQSNVQKQTDNQFGSGIVVPANLLSCPDEFVAEKLSDEVMKTCFDKTGDWCSYYKTVKDGVTKIHNLQFTSECNLCRTHKQKGAQFNDNNGEIYIHLGYEKKACAQGMYQTK
ncbi:MAG: hypothetical protein NTX82_06920 [Candidatus Parcubacteria bacterium]|nr:hypothetical protein [Candidatus Parcubacteria bacterium]